MTGTQKPTIDFEARVQHFARCRAYVLQAIHAKPGMTYTEIRKWIEEHKRFTMERVQARCSELYGLGYARREAGEDNRMHVYPVGENPAEAQE